MIRGYKAYKKGLVNQFGEKHEVGKTYSTSDVIYEKQGLYFSPNLEDTLRYYNGLKEEIDIALVEGSGLVREYFDDYNETSIIAATNLKVLKILTREEIIQYALRLNELRLCRFLAGFRLNEEEIKLFENQREIVKEYINYYQRGDEDAFTRK